jgi:hypothetical protein
MMVVEVAVRGAPRHRAPPPVALENAVLGLEERIVGTPGGEGVVEHPFDRFPRADGSTREAFEAASRRSNDAAEEDGGVPRAEEGDARGLVFPHGRRRLRLGVVHAPRVTRTRLPLGQAARRRERSTVRLQEEESGRHVVF